MTMTMKEKFKQVTKRTTTGKKKVKQVTKNDDDKKTPPKPNR